nr:MAG TPA: hypothetical protein [Caudoviricetes sp.]
MFHGTVRLDQSGRIRGRILPEFKAVMHIIRQRPLLQLQRDKPGPYGFPYRMHQDPRIFLLKHRLQLPKLVISVLSSKHALSPQHPVGLTQILHEVPAEGYFVNHHAPAVLHRIGLRIMGPGVVLIPHAGKPHTHHSSPSGCKAAVIPAGVPLECPGQLLSSDAGCLPGQNILGDHRPILRLGAGCPPAGGRRLCGNHSGGHAIACSVTFQHFPGRRRRCLPGMRLPQSRGSGDLFMPDLPGSPDHPVSRRGSLPGIQVCRSAALRPIHLPFLPKRLLRLEFRLRLCSQQKQFQRLFLAQQLFPDQIHGLTLPSVPQTAPGKIADSPLRGREVPALPAAAKASPSPGSSVLPIRLHHSGTPPCPCKSSSLPVLGRYTGWPAPEAPPSAFPARFPAAAMPKEAAAHQFFPSSNRGLDALGSHHRDLFRHHGVELSVLLDSAPLASAVNDLPIRLTDHQGEVPQVVEVDTVRDSVIGGVQAGQFQGILALSLNGGHRLTLAEGLHALTGFGRLGGVALHYRHFFTVQLQIDV